MLEFYRKMFLPIITRIDKVWTKLMLQMSKRQESSRHQTSVVCLDIVKRLKILFKVIMSLSYVRPSQYVFKVHDEYTNTIDLDNCSCTCNMWALCVHVVYCIKVGILTFMNILRITSSHLKFYSTYSHHILPILDEDQLIVLPSTHVANTPVYKHGYGRRIKKQDLIERWSY